MVSYHNNRKVTKATAIKLPDDPAIPLIGWFIFKRSENTYPYKNVYKNVHRKMNGSSQNVEI